MANAQLASAPPPGEPVADSIRFCTICLAVFRTDFERCPQDGAELRVAKTDPLIGATIGDKYVIEALIGEGAMGRVYRAHHHAFENQRYALKVLIGDLAASSTMRMRFAREAQSASRLDHPNVVNVIDYGKTAYGLHYLVMDLVEGCSLATILQRGPMPADRVIRIAHQLCEGLDHAHSRGVIHRDFKSDNILIVGEPGREIARIADFGLAMSTTRDVRLTTTGVACTPAYAAPEQLRGGDIDHRVDLYGLGATLFEMLSGGYLPFEGDLEATVSSKLRFEAPSIVTRAPNVPPGLVTLVSRLLAHDVDQRPRSARAVIRALETSMTLPRPPIRTLDMRPIAKRRSARRSRLLSLKAALVVTTLSLLASLALHVDKQDLLASGPRSAEAAIAEPRLVVHAEEVTPIEPPPAVATRAPSQPPVATPVAKSVVTKRKARKSTRRARVAQSASEADEVPSEPTALDVATQYSDVGRKLKAMQAEQGDDSTFDLWPRYRLIRISEAMGSQRSRNETAALLGTLQAAIDERSR